MTAGSPHDAPSAAELITAVREWIEGDVMAGTEGRLRYHARVAANVLAIVERELAVGSEQATAHAHRLATLGATSDAELAEAIRDGKLDDRYDEVKAAVWASVRDKLAVAHPGYDTTPANPHQP